MRMSKLALAFVASLSLVFSFAGARSHASHVTTLVAYAPPDLPEGVVMDSRGNLYLSMLLTGQIRKITPDGAESVFATLRVDPNAGFLVSLAIDRQDNIYAALASHNAPGADTHGLWRIRPNGAKELVSAFPDDTGLPNEIALDRTGTIYVSDSVLGLIWRILPGGEATVWLKDPTLRPKSPGDNPCNSNAIPLPVGINGITFGPDGTLYAANMDMGQIVRIPVNARTGQPGTPQVWLADCANLNGLDGIAFDVQGNLYAAVGVQKKVIRISPNRRIETLATADDGLDSPANVRFGTTASTRTNLYITNHAFATIVAGGTPNPSLKVLDAGMPGRRLP